MTCECCGQSPAVEQQEGTALYTPKARCRACKQCAHLRHCGVLNPGRLKSGYVKGPAPPGRKRKWDKR